MTHSSTGTPPYMWIWKIQSHLHAISWLRPVTWVGEEGYTVSIMTFATRVMLKVILCASLTFDVRRHWLHRSSCELNYTVVCSAVMCCYLLHILWPELSFQHIILFQLSVGIMWLAEEEKERGRKIRARCAVHFSFCYFTPLELFWNATVQ